MSLTFSTCITSTTHFCWKPKRGQPCAQTVLKDSDPDALKVSIATVIQTPLFPEHNFETYVRVEHPTLRSNKKTFPDGEKNSLTKTGEIQSKPTGA